MWGSVQPFVDYTKKFGDVVEYKLANEGMHVLLSNPSYADHVFKSDKYLVAADKEYFDYTYGRLVGFKDGTSFTAMSNSHPSNLDRWQRMRAIFESSIASGPSQLAAISQ